MEHNGNTETVHVSCWACFADIEVSRQDYEADKERGLKKHYCSSSCAYLDLF